MLRKDGNSEGGPETKAAARQGRRFAVVQERRSARLDIHGGRAAALGGEFVVQFLPFVQGLQARPLHRADMNEHVLRAVAGDDEPEALRRVEPLHNTVRQWGLLNE